MSTEAMTVALAGNWLEQTPAAVMSNASVTYSNAQFNAGGGVTWKMTTTSDTTATLCWAQPPAWYPTWWVWPQDYYRPYYVPLNSCLYYTTDKVKLKSGEVERLRKAASRDAKLKAILNKFTPLIEVELEF